MTDKETEDIEINLILESIYQKYGYDFRNYSRAHIKRRIKKRMIQENLEHISLLQNEILHNIESFYELLRDFSINVTEMFRDPDLFKIIKNEIFPFLKTYPFIKIWHAGCASGEEAYSMAVLLQEADLLKKSQIYATDINEEELKKARDGIYSMEQINVFTSNYLKAGGEKTFRDYYLADCASIIMDQKLKKKITFANHNLVSDGIFGEMNLILCRNVLIYFGKELQNKVLKLFYESLLPGGYLIIGPKESIRFSETNTNFEVISEEFKVYKKEL